MSLEDLSCVIRPGCTDHSPWPEGICTKCQPSAVTLARQSYRHVDNIMFEDGAIVNRFIEGWRQSGRQVCSQRALSSATSFQHQLSTMSATACAAGWLPLWPL